MISNPCSWFKDGYTRLVFEYEGGSKLYHFSPHDNGLSTTMEDNIIFFADNGDHALAVLKRMLLFRINIARKDKGDFFEYGTKKAKLYLQAIEEGKVKIVAASMNQFYKVGWASN